MPDHRPKRHAFLRSDIHGYSIADFPFVLTQPEKHPDFVRKLLQKLRFSPDADADLPDTTSHGLV